MSFNSHRSFVVACAATAATSPVNRSLAQGILRFLLQPTLLHANSLPQLFDDSGNLSLQALRFHFEDVVYVRARPTSLLCSCAAATMHAQCEHSTFLRSLALPTFPSTHYCSMMSQKLASVPGVEQLLLSRRGNGADVQGDLLQRKPLVQVPSRC